MEIHVQTIGEHFNSFFEFSHTFMCLTMLRSVVLNVAIVCPGLANTGKNVAIFCVELFMPLFARGIMWILIRNILRKIVKKFL